MGAGAQREIEMGDIQETDIAQITQRARDFLQGEHFEQAGGLGMVSAFAQLVEAIEEEVGERTVGFRIEDGKKVRFAKTTGDVIDA